MPGPPSLVVTNGLSTQDRAAMALCVQTGVSELGPMSQTRLPFTVVGITLEPVLLAHTM